MPESIRIKTTDLRVGSRYSSPLYFDDGKLMFLAGNLTLSQRYLDYLHQWNIPFVLTSGVETTPLAEELDDEDIPELEAIG